MCVVIPRAPACLLDGRARCRCARARRCAAVRRSLVGALRFVKEIASASAAHHSAPRICKRQKRAQQLQTLSFAAASRQAKQSLARQASEAKSLATTRARQAHRECVHRRRPIRNSTNGIRRCARMRSCSPRFPIRL